MAEIRETEVRMFAVEAHCDRCGEPLIPTGHQAERDGQMMVGHKCRNCGNLEALPTRYPVMRYVPVSATYEVSPPPPKCEKHPSAHIGVARNAGSDQHRYVCYTGGCNLGAAPAQPEAGWEPG